MVSSAVLGAAAGTGLALVVAMTILIYRYYAVKRKVKYWSSLDRWPDPPTTIATRNHHQHQCANAQFSQVLDCWRKPQQSYYTIQSGLHFVPDTILKTTSILRGNGEHDKKPRKALRNITHKSETSVKDAVVLRLLYKAANVPDKLSEVLGDVLELACGGSGGAGGGGGGEKKGSSTVSKIGVVTGVAIIRGRWAQRGSRSPHSSVANTDSADSTTSTTSSEEFNVAKEQHAVQPSSVVIDSGCGLPHQSRSYPSGDGGERVLLQNSSVTSQDYPDFTVGNSPQRGSSPQIRAYGPDGRHYHHDPLHAASSYPPNRSSRSPSPARAVSLDARCGSPASYTGSIQSGTASPSQTSLSSTATGIASACGSARGRCLSPLLIPPPRSSVSDTASAPPASPLGSLQPDLYLRRDGPLFLNARSRSGKSLGRLHLRLKYDFDKSDLHVHLIEAQDLAGSDQGGFNDPYVKLTLSPEVDSRKRQTPIHRNDPNPFFDQHFKFPVSHEDLQDKNLVLQVFDYDRFSRNDVVGSVKVAMEELELISSSSSVEVWGEITRERKPPEEIQEVLLSLSYLPSAERLTVVILKARNLFPLQGKESLDPFVKVSLLSGEKRVKKKKTAVRKSTMSPVWNEALSFNVPAGLLATSAIEVCVLDSSSELIGSNAVVGSCIVGPGASGSSPIPETGNQSREHWQHMTHSPRKGMAMWHTLR